MLIARSAAARDTLAVQAGLQEIIKLHPSNRARTWGYFARKLDAYLNDPSLPIPFQIFANGNSKLPFVAFSAAPIVTCPGAGECENWCYSFRAWRGPAAFFRQILNTLLIVHQSDVISKAFQALPEGIALRLYVDGDFDSLDTARFWFRLLKSRPDIQAYGYSKSWDILLSVPVDELPANYRLNLSSGGNGSEAQREALRALPITRGEFLALPIDIPKMSNDVKYSSPVYKTALREAWKSANPDRPTFLCPGKCGSCTKKEHACGSERFNNVPILIGIH
jgi:hypothetical protein